MKENNNKENVQEIERIKLILNFYDDHVEKEIIKQPPFIIDKTKKNKKTTKND